MNPSVIIYNLGVMGTITQTVGVMLGVALFFSGIFRLKRYGEMRTFMSYQMTISQPLMMMLAGVLFLLLPTIIDTGMLALWGDSNPMAYTGSDTALWSMIEPIIIFVRLVGVWSFMNGLILLSRTGGTQSAPGTWGKATIHMLGGLLLINIVATYNLAKSILGLF